MRFNIVLKKARDVTPEDVTNADAYAFGSPSHFSIMSGEILTMFTNMYPHGISLQVNPHVYSRQAVEAKSLR